MKTVSSVGSATDRSAKVKPAASAASTIRGTSRVHVADLQLHPVRQRPRAGQSVQPGREGLGELLGVAGGLDGDDGVGAHAALELGRRVEGEDPAVVHDGHPVTELVGLFHVVRGEHDRLALGVEALEELPQRQTALGVEPGSGLVEEEDGGPVEDGPRHHEALGHAAREGVDRRLGEARQLEPLQEVVGRLAGLLGPHAEQAAVEVQVLPWGELAVEGVLLRDDPDDLLDERRVLDHVDAAHAWRCRRWGSPGS